MSGGYKPERPDRKMLNIANILAIAGLAAMWIFHEKIGLEPSSLLALSGIALFCLLLFYSDKKKCAENYRTAQLLKKQRDEISSEDFSDNGEFYFRNEEKKQ